MAARIAPKAGYNTDIKAQYRENVWDAFSPGIADIIADTTGTLKAVIMPSSEGLEIEVALARGLRQEQIVCVDRSAAVIATSKWRKRWPGVKFFADEMATVGERIAKAGCVVRVANLDLCGNFSDDTIEAVRGFLTSAPLYRKLSFAVTMAKGREGAALTKLLHKVGARLDLGCPRMACMFELFKEDTPHLGGLQCSSQGSYIASRVPMSWAVFTSVDAGVSKAALREVVKDAWRGGGREAEYMSTEDAVRIARMEKELGVTRTLDTSDKDFSCGFPLCSVYEGIINKTNQGSNPYFFGKIAQGHQILDRVCYLCGEEGVHTYPDGRHICGSNHDIRSLDPIPSGGVYSAQNTLGYEDDIRCGFGEWGDGGVFIINDRGYPDDRVWATRKKGLFEIEEYEWGVPAPHPVYY